MLCSDCWIYDRASAITELLNFSFFVENIDLFFLWPPFRLLVLFIKEYWSLRLVVEAFCSGLWGKLSFWLWGRDDDNEFLRGAVEFKRWIPNIAPCLCGCLLIDGKEYIYGNVLINKNLLSLKIYSIKGTISCRMHQRTNPIFTKREKQHQLKDRLAITQKQIINIWWYDLNMIIIIVNDLSRLSGIPSSYLQNQQSSFSNLLHYI